MTVLGLGRMGSAMAERLLPHHDVRTWTRSAGGSPGGVVADADVSGSRPVDPYAVLRIDRRGGIAGADAEHGYTCSREATAAATRSMASSIGTPLSWRPSR